MSSFDDFPIHQTSAPVAETSTSDLNYYDRSFFNGYERDGSLYFGVATGLYPNRHITDAAFSVMVDDQQISVLASQRAPDDRRDVTHVGPVCVDVVVPMHQLRVTVDAPAHGLSADLTFTARSAPVEEPRYLWKVGLRTLLDYTRFTQFGTWDGWIDVDGGRHTVSSVWGSRDRSWGVRPVGETVSAGAPVNEPQFFWLWAPVNFPALSTHFDVNELSDGRRWHEAGALVRSDGSPVESMRAVDYRVEWRPGTRWAQHFEYDLIDSHSRKHTVRLQPRREFLMSGLGYGHPEFGHGFWKGEAVVAGQRIAVPVATPCSRQHLHIQALCDAAYIAPDGSTETGVGILEQLVVGRHPTGLSGVFDPYSAGEVLSSEGPQR